MCPKHIRQQRTLRMSETKDQMCSVQCWGCGGSLLWKVPWSALIDDTDNDINTDNNCVQCQKKDQVRREGVELQLSSMYVSTITAIFIFCNVCLLYL